MPPTCAMPMSHEPQVADRSHAINPKSTFNIDRGENADQDLSRSRTLLAALRLMLRNDCGVRRREYPYGKRARVKMGKPAEIVQLEV
jgi:hypothetical protein